MKKSSPAWTLRGRSTDAPAPSVPGPGAYNPTSSNLESSPKYQIGKSSRILRRNSDNPGPGAYDPHQAGKMSPRAV